jgi:hypothetical protein
MLLPPMDVTLQLNPRIAAMRRLAKTLDREHESRLLKKAFSEALGV